MSNVQAKIDNLTAKFEELVQALDRKHSATSCSKGILACCILASVILAPWIASLLAAGGFPVALLELPDGFDGTTLGNIVDAMGVSGRIDQTTKDILEAVEEIQRDESRAEALEVARQLVATRDEQQKSVEAIRKEVALMAQELGDRDKEQLETRDKISYDLQVWELVLLLKGMLSTEIMSQHGAVHPMCDLPTRNQTQILICFPFAFFILGETLCHSWQEQLR